MFEEQIKKSELRILRNKLKNGVVDDTLFNKMLSRDFCRYEIL